MMSSSTSKADGKYTSQLYFDPNADLPQEEGFWFKDDELRQKLANMVDISEDIIEVRYYTNPLHSWQLTNAMMYHAFLVFETNNWWWSLEKNMEGVTIQRSRKLESITEYYRREKRTTGTGPNTGITLFKKRKGQETMTELVNFLWRKNLLLKEYHTLSYNCQHLANLVFARYDESSLFRDDNVYFDAACDQPVQDAKPGIISIDRLFIRVEELTQESGDEPPEYLKRIDVYSAPINSYQLIQTMMYHLYVIFETDSGQCWSVERGARLGVTNGSQFTVQRSREKDTLINRCERSDRPFNRFCSIQQYRSGTAKRMTMKDVVHFIWKDDKLNSTYDVLHNNSKDFAKVLYNQFMDHGRKM